MKFNILTLFPDMFKGVLEESIIGRAEKKGILSFNYVNIRDFTNDKHGRVDDYAYGGGTGLVMAVQPIYDAWKATCGGKKKFTVYMSPQGKPLNQQLVEKLSTYDELVIICGHYEGIDERVIEEVVDMEVSIGDYVLTGGEIPAMAMIDAVSRLVPGVLPGEEAYSEESHYNGLLEYPNYTRPETILGKTVPDVLLSGHHKNIETWKRRQSLFRTWLKRPDLLRKAKLSKDDEKFVKKLKYKRRNKVQSTVWEE